MHKFILLVNTVKFLKPIQIYYRIFYALRRKYRQVTQFEYAYLKPSNSYALMLKKSIDMTYSTYEENSFNLLNLVKKFDHEIDWNFSNYGKLWTYNLTYFEYIKKKEDVKLIYDFIEKIENVKDGLEPFPISLRGIFWIKFLTRHNIKDKKIDDSLYAQYDILLDNLEYHLLGNHLLENSFSLLFGAYYFQDEKLYKKAKEILEIELHEQILQDGAHFELSPMYHQLMLFRVLDCLNLLKHNECSFVSKSEQYNLYELLENRAKKMLVWLENITFQNGDIPLFNDSTKRVAPSTKHLLDYAKSLDIVHTQPIFHFGESGYRKIVKKAYECIVDIGKIGPDYIPGHAHADTFTFEVYIGTLEEKSNNIPFIVDTGLSTYETNERRMKERSTSAHNTVEVEHKNSSDVWGGFRVGKRAQTTHLEEDRDVIIATHDGYNDALGTIHSRSWSFSDAEIIIQDTLNNSCTGISRLHFHPDITEEMIKEKISIKGGTFMVRQYYYACEFNKLQKALVLEISFETESKVTIRI